MLRPDVLRPDPPGGLLRQEMNGQGMFMSPSLSWVVLRVLQPGHFA